MIQALDRHTKNALELGGSEAVELDENKAVTIVDVVKIHFITFIPHVHMVGLYSES